MKLVNDQQKKPPLVASKKGLKVLLVNASSRFEDSVTRRMTEKLVEELRHRHGIAELTIRDVAAEPLPVIDQAWVAANFTDSTNRTAAQKSLLAQSDNLVGELQRADVIILGVPIYNFSVPAALKAWIDLIARAGVTFRYTSEGPVGLLKDKQAFVVVASGGVAIDSEIDFATPYMRHVLGFVGIEDVEIITAERLNIDSNGGKQQAEQQVVQAATRFSRKDRQVA